MIRFWISFCLICLSSWLFAGNQEGASKQVVLKFMETTDVHGNFFSYDFVNLRSLPGGWSRVITYVNSQRDSLGKESCLLLDAGDILQGQPCVYYSNFMDTLQTHLAAEVMNYMQYDAACIGNHDIEAGHPVYDRWIADCNFPVLGANILSETTRKPYAKPYCIVNRNGVKIAILGLITPAIPMWLPQDLWKGLSFEDMVKAARRWAAYIQEHEQPDVIVGLFHTGLKGAGINGFNEHAAEEIALTVPGFDVIFFGHDHQRYCKEVVNPQSGKAVWLLNAGGEATHVAEAELVVEKNNQRAELKEMRGKLISMEKHEPDSAFMKRFEGTIERVKNFTEERLGTLPQPIYTFDYFWGKSTMADLLHQVQFAEMKADISLITPLTYKEVIPAGSLSVKDIFKLYRYENRIEVFQLTGKEIKGAMEQAYGLWTNTMTSPTDHVLNIVSGKNGKMRLGAATFYLLSAAGITYQVDVTQPKGNKIRILHLSNGTPFRLDQTYRVAVNSYIGSGGGGLLTTGTGIALDDLPSRIVEVSAKDLRYYLMEYIRRQEGPVNIPPLSDWYFTPKAYVEKALKRDRQLLQQQR